MAKEPPSKEKVTRSAGLNTRPAGKSANESTRKSGRGVEGASKRLKELDDKYNGILAQYNEAAGGNPDEISRLKGKVDTAAAAYNALNNSMRNLDSIVNFTSAAEAAKIVNATKAEAMDIQHQPPDEPNPVHQTTDEPSPEHQSLQNANSGGLFVPQNTQPRANATNPNDTRRSESADPDRGIPDFGRLTPADKPNLGDLFVPQNTRRSESADPDRGTPDFGRWTPAEEDEYYIQNSGYTPAEAREAAGLEIGGEIVAWATHGNSTPVIVAYGPRNSRKYKRSTAYREADFLDETKIKQFGPEHRFGDKKVKGKLVRKPHEFKTILGVAFNCPVEELMPKPPKKKGDAPSARSPRVDIWVKWEIDGKVETSWEVRSSIKHLFRSFCDQYIYESALHFEAQYNLYNSGTRTADDRLPTPFPRAAPVDVQIKKEGQAVNLTAPAIQITKPVNTAASTTLSPIKQYREEWCDLKDIDPKKMTAEDGVNCKLAWDMVQLKLKA